MLTGLTEKQNAFKMVVKQFAESYVNEGKAYQKADSLIPNLKMAGKMAELDFESLFTDYQANFLIEEIDTELTQLEKEHGMADDLSCNCGDNNE